MWKYAAMAIGNLAVVAQNQEEIAKEGGLRPLVALSSPFLSCAHYAARIVPTRCKQTKSS